MTSVEVRARQEELSERLVRVAECCPFWDSEDRLELVQFEEGVLPCLEVYHWEVVPWVTGYKFWVMQDGSLVERFAMRRIAHIVDPREVVGGYVPKLIAALNELEMSFESR